jgi:hypothetical protein
MAKSGFIFAASENYIVFVIAAFIGTINITEYEITYEITFGNIYVATGTY